MGQLVSVVDGLGHTIFHADASGDYDGNGNLVHSVDALGTQYQQGYDGLNRLVRSVRNYNGTDTATQNATTAYGYDSLDRLTQVTDPTNLTTAYSYDGLSNAMGEVSPDTGTTGRTFDAAGNMLTRTDANGITATVTYDGLNRPLTVNYSASGQNISYHYDEANSVTGCPSTTAPVGQLTRIVEANVTTVFCRDPHGNLIERKQMTPSGTDYTEMTYTAGDRLSHRIYPDGANASYRRDANGQISAIDLSPPHRGASPAVSNVSYLPFGPISRYTLGNGQTITRSYDANQQLADLTSPALNLHYARDAMGNITAQGDAPGATHPTETYSYDPLYRLTQLSAGGTAQESMSYNASGDRTGKSGSGLATGTYSYNPGTHQLIATGSYVRAVDAAGNTTATTLANGLLGLGYNARNHLTAVTSGNNTVGSYTYNALGERIQKTAGATTTRFIYDDDQQRLTAEAAGSSTRDYVWLDELPVAVVDSVSGSARAINYVTADALGTPRAISNTSSVTIWQWSSTGNAWGEAAPSSNGYVFNLRYPGQYYDAESGLNYNVHRYYESATGRYLQSDPMGLGAGLSTYAYVGNSPLSYVDSNGWQITGTVNTQSVDWGLRANDNARILAYLVTGVDIDQVNPPGDDSIQSVVTPMEFMVANRLVVGAGMASRMVCPGAQAATKTTRLFRAVTQGEIDSIKATGGFSAGRNSLGGKWLAESASDAQRWGDLMNGEGNSTILQVDLPTSQADQLMRNPRLDGIGPARYGELDQLDGAKITW